MQVKQVLQGFSVARSERFELPTLGFEVRCSIQLSYERSFECSGYQSCQSSSTTGGPGFFVSVGMLNGFPTH